MNNRNIELLAPVGNKESLIAAVNNGCDAVYLGGKAFSARQYAGNFSVEEMEEVLDYCHLRNVKVYVTVNTLYKEKELESLFDFLNQLYRLGADAFIVQDLGTAVKIKEYFPDIDIHGSTQMTIHDLNGVKFLEELGFKRVVLSREMSLEEIAYIAKNTSMEIEVFVHGALCFSYSGQCLMSSVIGGRSGNRGRCAQPCRLPYNLADAKNKHIASGYLLSPKDIQTLEYIPQLIESGVTSFKIEGRMKRPEYNASVVNTYRKYIDQYFLNQKDYSVDYNDIKNLAQVFNRGGFSKGYLGQHSGRDMMSFESPKHWGIYAGKVVQYNSSTKKCVIDTVEPLEPGDGIEIWRKGKENTGVAISKSSKGGERITVFIKDPVQKGDLVYKTKDKPLLDALKKTYEKDVRKSTVFGHIKFKKYIPILLQLWDDRNNFIEVEGSIVQEAQNQALTEERLKSQISKTGNTPFNIESLTVDMDEDGYLPIGELNALRRKAVEKLEKSIINNTRRSFVNIKNVDGVLNQEGTPDIKEKSLSILLRDIDQLEAAFHPKVKRIYLEMNQYSIEKFQKAAEACHENNIEFFAALPRIDVNYKKEKLWYNLENTLIDGYLIRTYGQAYKLKNTCKKRIADYTFNFFNPLTSQFWMTYGMEGVTLSPELNYEELKNFRGDGIEIIGYGYLPLMITQQCIIGNTVGEKSLQGFCKNRNDQKSYKLIDRKGEAFPIIQDCSSCLAVIYNGKPILLLNELDKLVSLPVDYIRLDFVFESVQDIKTIIESYGNCNKGLFPKIKGQEYTKGHFFRGVE
ncbi:U32 family peptidase [Defluviitalea raffinosedens]|uniref:U32 family peptidase n=1 Tax=Defluviitalea raffinosedens TaxID=1450156 RepID=UPI001764604F|nr:U32 family peptidase [Defluviitalea raffinosedens]MBM7686413.1 putative protease [Defluviitalea raffinosedens]HHW67199.1 U32 family peptidase [Candidatus Epulonipiscium sp.]